jgi:hypothetical protein
MALNYIFGFLTSGECVHSIHKFSGFAVYKECEILYFQGFWDRNTTIVFHLIYFSTAKLSLLDEFILSLLLTTV